MDKVLGFLLLWLLAIFTIIVLKVLAIAPVAAWPWVWVLSPIWGMWGLGLMAYGAHCLVGHD